MLLLCAFVNTYYLFSFKPLNFKCPVVFDLFLLTSLGSGVKYMNIL